MAKSIFYKNGPPFGFRGIFVFCLFLFCFWCSFSSLVKILSANTTWLCKCVILVCSKNCWHERILKQNLPQKLIISNLSITAQYEKNFLQKFNARKTFDERSIICHNVCLGSFEETLAVSYADFTNILDPRRGKGFLKRSSV